MKNQTREKHCMNLIIITCYIAEKGLPLLPIGPESKLFGAVYVPFEIVVTE
jgi:hypothetical protein